MQQAAIEDDEASDVIPKEMNGIAVQQIPLHEIQANRYQPRHEFDESALEELKESIVQHGVLQPILVRQLPAGKGYELVAGERRFRASRLAGFETVPALVRPLSDAASTEIALIENLQREDLNAIEEANAYRNLLQNFGLTQEALAERVGRSRSHITNMMRLLKLDAHVQEYLANGSLSMGQARPLVVLTDAALQREAADIIMARECSARQAEELVKRLQKNAEETAEAKEAESPEETEKIFLQEAEDKLKMFFGTQVRIRSRGKKNRIEIDFSSEEDLNRILDSLLEKKSRLLEDKKAALRQFSAGERFTV
ncbi:ParB/RepB/Spo0J family partition protein [uncultured Selenomonas sp.]|uniref:ParB/RepB/Spo0J family partition protein n=1 Tax=uncultured Selenomonas sp. TaxID=159275 RepID=UPI0037DD08B8